MNLKAATPAEIDSQLAELYRAEMKLRAAVKSAIESLHYMLGERSTGRTRKLWPTTDQQAREAAEARRTEVPRSYSRTFGDQLDKLAGIEAELAANLAEQAPLDAEYASRPWSRFLIVAGGHIHSSRHCSTCNKGQYLTEFGWMPEMSGMDEAEALVALAEKSFILCTVCFPNAPVQPEVVDSKHCAGSGLAPITGTVRGGMSKYGDCTVCTDRPLIVGGGVTRKHKAKELREQAPAAPAVEAPAPAAVAEALVAEADEANGALAVDAGLLGQHYAEAAATIGGPAGDMMTEVASALGAVSSTAAALVAANTEAPAELPVDVDGRPIPVGVLVECVGAETETLTGRRGRVIDSGFFGDGTGRIVIDWPNRPTWSPTARTASRVRVVDPASLDRATIGQSATVHAYAGLLGETGCGYRNPAEPRVALLLDEATPITCTELGCRPHNVPAMIGSHGSHHFIPGDQAGGPTSGPCSLRWPTPCGRPYRDPLHVPFPNPLTAPAAPAAGELVAQVGAPEVTDGRRPVVLAGQQVGIVRPIEGGWCGWSEQGVHVTACTDPGTPAHDSAQHAAEAVVDTWLEIESKPGGRMVGITWSGRVRWLPEQDAPRGRLAELAGEPELVDSTGEVWYVDKEAISGDLYRCVGHEGPSIPLDRLDDMLGPLRVPPGTDRPSGT